MRMCSGKQARSTETTSPANMTPEMQQSSQKQSSTGTCSETKAKTSPFTLAKNRMCTPSVRDRHDMCGALRRRKKQDPAGKREPTKGMGPCEIDGNFLVARIEACKKSRA